MPAALSREQLDCEDVQTLLGDEEADPLRRSVAHDVARSPYGHGVRLSVGRLRRIAGGVALFAGVVATLGAVGRFSGHSVREAATGLVGLAANRRATESKCKTAEPGGACYKASLWAKTDGIFAHPEWYPDLTKHAGVAQFQAVVHANSPKHECTHAPCEQDVKAQAAEEREAIAAEKAAAKAAAAQQPPPAPAPAATAPQSNFHFDVPLPPAKAGGAYRWNITCAAPLVPMPEPVVRGKSSSEVMSCGCPPPQVLGGSGASPTCVDPPGMAKMTFYVYRAQGDDDYPPENVNAADLAGVMWYLHNEVVPSVPRKFGVTRILRYKVTMQNPQIFYDRFHKQFGPFVAFDSAKCTAPTCNNIWNKYGFVIGCQNLDRSVVNVVRDYVAPSSKEPEEVDVRKLAEHTGGEHPEQHRGHDAHSEGDRRVQHGHDIPTTSPRHPHDDFHGGIWYSFPGACPESTIGQKSAECLKRMPGGRCNAVNGDKDCTYDFEPAGFITLNELSGILDEEKGIRSYDDWWKKTLNECLAAVQAGQRQGPCVHNAEYDVATDKGIGCDFWNGKHDLQQGVRRMNRMRELFVQKYPHMPPDFAEPACL